MRSLSNNGAALVMALFILVALMLMGLPFLFSQSTSVHGAYLFSKGQQSIIEQHNTENIGMDLGQRIVKNVVASGTAPRSKYNDGLDEINNALNANDPNPENYVRKDNKQTNTLVPLYGTEELLQVDIDLLREFKLKSFDPSKAASLTIIDESGLIDVNSLGPEGWTVLLKQVGIDDWDDGGYRDPTTRQWVDDTNSSSPTWDSDDLHSDINSDPDDDDHDQNTELAEALAFYRFKLPNKRYTALEQLLEADPGHNNKDNRIYSHGNTIAANSSFGYRKPLTQQELELLRPVLTFNANGQGKNNEIDIGSLAWYSSASVFAIDFNYALFEDIPGLSNMLCYDTFLLSPYSAPQDTKHIAESFRKSWNPDNQSGLWNDYHQDAIHGVYHSEPDITFNSNSTPALSVHTAQPINYHVAPQSALLYLATSTNNVNQNDLLTQQLITNPLELPRSFTPPPSDPPLATLVRESPVFDATDKPPAGKRSHGIYRIQSAAESLNPAGQSMSYRQREITAQILPNGDLEHHWETQLELRNHSFRRFTSLLTTWPRPLNRYELASFTPAVTDQLNANNPAFYKPIPLLSPELPRDEQFSRTWAAHKQETTHENFLGGATDPLGYSSTNVSSTTSIDNVTPDGMRLTNDTYAFPVQGATTDRDHFAQTSAPSGLIGDDGDPNTPNDTGSITNQKMDEHFVSFWLTPGDSWDESGAVTLLEMRPPQENCGQPYANISPFVHDLSNPIDQRVDGSTTTQNHWSLRYDNGRLILKIANGIIEQEYNYGPTVPLLNNNTDPLLSGLDTRSLGTTSGEKIEEDQGTDLARQQLAPARRRNSFEHFYQMTLKQGQAYYIQVSTNNLSPIGQSIIVDGIVGRNLNSTRTPADGSRTGDHLTAPYHLLLKTDVDCTTLDGEATDTISLIGIDNNLLNTTTFDWLPTGGGHGTIEIQGKMISFASWTQNGRTATINYCNSYNQLGTLTAEAPAYPYFATALTFTSSTTPNTSPLPRGGSTLINWTESDGPALPAQMIHRTDDYTEATSPTGKFTISDIPPRVAHTIEVRRDQPEEKGRFPAGGGYIRISGGFSESNADLSQPDDEYAFYTSATESELILAADGREKCTATIDFKRTTSKVIGQVKSFRPITITLISFAATLPPDDNKFAYHEETFTDDGNTMSPSKLPSNSYTRNYIQIYNVQSDPGKIEWLTYTDTIQRGKTLFFIDRSGAAWERNIIIEGTTPPAAPDGTTAFGDLYPWEGGSRIMPVHNKNNHRLRSGDMLTLVPKHLGTTSTPRPYQAAIRYTSGNYFSFCEALPDLGTTTAPPQTDPPTPAPQTTVTAYQWPGNNIDMLPWLNALAPQFTQKDEALIFVGGQDSRHSTDERMDATIDLLRTSKALWTYPNINILFDDEIALGTSVTLSSSIRGTSGVGLIEFGDEVLAYTGQGRSITILGRGLFGTDVHDSDYFRDPKPLRLLPHKTGIRLAGNEQFLALLKSKGANFQGPLSSHDRTTDRNRYIPRNTSGFDSRAPAFLIIQPGAPTNAYEIALLVNEIQQVGPAYEYQQDPTDPNPPNPLPNPPPPGQVRALNNRLVIAPWLRGAYNTEIIDQLDENTLIFPWYPRYPSALPHTAAAADIEEYQLRSRSFAWAGFPMRYHRCSFEDLTNPAAHITWDNDNNNFKFEVRALESGYNWQQAISYPVNSLGEIQQFTFPNKETNGIEMRIHWRYNFSGSSHSDSDTAQLESIASTNRAPRIGAVTMRCRAPSYIISTQE